MRQKITKNADSNSFSEDNKKIENYLSSFSDEEFIYDKYLTELKTQKNISNKQLYYF
jgi:hypothetical protein